MYYSFITFLRVPGIIASMMCLSACSKWVSADPPQGQTSASEVFSGDGKATEAVLGLYIQVMDNNRALLNGGMSLYGGLSSDELYRTTAFGLEDAFTLNALTSMNTLCNNLYSAGYTCIYLCNNILQQLTRSSGVSDSTRQQLHGEAMFMRALIYFYLVNLYGDIPLVTDTDFQANAILPRSPVGKVYLEIVKDLQDAEKSLHTQYVTESGYANDRTRPNQAAAMALLSRVYLYGRDWLHAEQAATSVTDLPIFQLEAPDSVFGASSREAIWQLQPVHNNMSTAEGSMFIPSGQTGSNPVYALTDSLVNSFERGDLRLLRWTAHSSGGYFYIYPYKYHTTSITAVPKEYNTVLRLSEQYLIRAEARVYLGDIAGAIEDLDKVRHRAGLPGTTASNAHDLLIAIGHERRVEFFAEWGHRWLDLKRTGQADPLLRQEKTNWKAQDTLYPIPYTELVHNPYLVQNAGY